MSFRVVLQQANQRLKYDVVRCHAVPCPPEVVGKAARRQRVRHHALCLTDHCYANCHAKRPGRAIIVCRARTRGTGFVAA